MQWLTRPLKCGRKIVAAPLDPAALTDADLRDICLRMRVILETIEMPRCEGRLMPYNLFLSIDTLESMVLHAHPSPYGEHSPPRLAEWMNLIREFGQYYSLDREGPIPVTPAIYRKIAAQYGGAS